MQWALLIVLFTAVAAGFAPSAAPQSLTRVRTVSNPIMQQGRGRGRGGGRGVGRGAPPRAVRYIPEAEMETLVRDAALRLDFDEGQADMLGACGRNIYAMGCGYHPTTVTIFEEICGANANEAWATLLLRCVEGTMPRLRSEATATARMNAARAAAARRRAMAGS